MIRNRQALPANPITGNSRGVKLTTSGDRKKHKAQKRRTLCRCVFVGFLFVIFGIDRLIPSNDVVFYNDPRYYHHTQQQSKEGNLRQQSNAIAATDAISPKTESRSVPIPTRKEHPDKIPDEIPDKIPKQIPKSGTTDRYKPIKIVLSMPENAADSKMLVTLVRDHQKRDEAWYKECAKDNATSAIALLRKGRNDIDKYYSRACPNTVEEMHYDPFENPKHKCPITSRIDLVIERNHFFEDWRIHTMDVEGNPKSVGGDNFYVVYSEHPHDENGLIRDRKNQPLIPMAVGIPTDYHNGTYGLDFVSVPFLDTTKSKQSSDEGKMGRLSVHVRSTCSIGDLYPPLKDGWKKSGHTNVVWTSEGVSRPYKLEDWYKDRYAPMLRNELLDPNNSKIRNSLLEFDKVVFAGDSVLNSMLWNEGKRQYHKIVADKIQSGKISNGPDNPVLFHMPLSPVTLTAFREELDQRIKRGFQNTTAHTALVLGSAVMDVIRPAEWQGPRFESHLSAIDKLLSNLRKSYPQMTLVWKLPYAYHGMHSCHDNEKCIRALRYATRERFYKLYRSQKSFIETKFAGDDKVLLLDLYEVSYLAGSHYWSTTPPGGDFIQNYKADFHVAVLEKLLYNENATKGQ